MDGQIVIPALALRHPDNDRFDAAATARYAQRAARTWVDAFILSGATTRGDQLTVDERAEVLDLWLGLVPAARLVACCWSQDDVDEATRRAITPMMVMRSLRNEEQALSLLASLPSGAYVYSHPVYSSTVLDAALISSARRRDVLPRGAKLSKITASDITAIRREAGSRWTLWHGSARQIGTSLAAGASGIVATPLSHVPTPFPDRSLSLLQPAIDAIQTQLDRLPSRNARSRMLHKFASEPGARFSSVTTH